MKHMYFKDLIKMFALLNFYLNVDSPCKKPITILFIRIVGQNN